MRNRVFILAFLLAALAAWTGRAEIVDRMVAVAGNRVITWSDLEREARYQAFLANEAPPGPEELARAEVRNQILTRLIDQRLLEQDRDMLPFIPPDGSETDQKLDELRQRYPSPQAYQQALARARLSEAELLARVERETNLMAFVDRRLRPQVRFDPLETELYYHETFEPELRRQGQTEIPELAEVREQIEEILAEQQMNRRLEQWLRDLRARMGVRILPQTAPIR
jgi:hypothetical protein